MRFVFALGCLLVAGLCARYLYEVYVPKPGTRPTFWQVVLSIPAGLVFFVALYLGVLTLF